MIVFLSIPLQLFTDDIVIFFIGYSQAKIMFVFIMNYVSILKRHTSSSKKHVLKTDNEPMVLFVWPVKGSKAS